FADHVRNALVAPVEGHLVDEMAEEVMEVGVGPGAGGHRGCAVAQDAAVGRKPIAPGVAENLAAIELVEGVGPPPRPEAHRTALEKLLEFSHDAEDADALVLIDVVEIAHGDDPFGRDGLVIDLDPWRDAGLSELGGRLGTYADELRQAFVWGRRRFRVLRD